MSAAEHPHAPVRDPLLHPAAKKEYNEELFSIVAPRYAFITRALSLGRDGSWKRRLVDALPPLREPCCVDLACGHGDITLLLAEKYPGGRVIGLDLTEAMLTLARARGAPGHVSFRKGDMCETGLPDQSADIVTGGYALRNAPSIEGAARCEYGLLSCWGGFWGWVMHRDPAVYTYIAATLRHFPARPVLRRLLETHGLEVYSSRLAFFGIIESLAVRKRAG